ncbi:hypothetical protein NE235_21320 [Actinoallomurus spadix]|uniref:DUF4253 domain-containing protein n=1 Tax=Actinoallomurus spadix TaxID=79912 RepID=A0ABN0WA38_9ACTN|nr:hypothetical protein [Actinoallomurus spadix]MCO5988651.1 hypothetical protein [Actinoallomurus spadix]
MGLDVYAVRPGDPAVKGHDTLRTPVTWEWEGPADLDPFEDVPRDFPEGLFWPSDGDSTGFRGQVYREWVNRTLGFNLYELLDPAQVRDLADRLDHWLTDARAAGTDEVPLDDATTVPLSGIEALAAFVRATAAQDLWLFPDS